MFWRGGGGRQGEVVAFWSVYINFVYFAADEGETELETEDKLAGEGETEAVKSPEPGNYHTVSECY